MKEELREKLKWNVYNAYNRGMSHLDLASAFNISHILVEDLIKEAEVDSASRKSHRDEDIGKSVLLDKIDEVVATCFARIAHLEQTDEAGQLLNNSPGNNNAFAGITNAILRAYELYAKIEGYAVTRVTGADGKSAVEIKAIGDREAAVKELIGRLSQLPGANVPSHLLEMLDQSEVQNDKTD